MESVGRVILFCDIHCFAGLSKALGDSLPQFIQSFYECVGREVVARGGKVLKYIGDSVLAVFPQGAEADAVRCALAMRAAFPSHVPASCAGIETLLEVAIGTGRVYHGTFGHESLRMEDVFGETVNETAVLCHAKGIALSRPVRDAVAGRFTTERQPDTSVKWRTEPLESWRVVEQG